MSDKIRWGIIGTGKIAANFAQGLSVLPEAELIAVGSRAGRTAEAFGEKFSVPRRYDSYAALAADGDIDVAYVATPHPMHMENALLCLEAGRAVLCEKPFAMNSDQARRMIELSRRKKLFLMEAMWTRFLPAMVKVRQLLAAGAVGEVRMVTADFGFRTSWNPEGRLLNPHLGGGGLLDVGVYAVSLSSMILHRPERVLSLAHIGQTGVDEQAAMILGHTGGRLALLSCAVRTASPMEAHILGTDGSIRIHSPWWRTAAFTLKSGGKEETFQLPFVSTGLNYEAQEVMDCLRRGMSESDVMPLEETLSVMKTLDEIRSQWALRYPVE
jgi:predicted dehydrogenase